MNLRQGTLLKHGEYRIERELGHGGFGVTYSAVQVGLNRRVAIKEFFMSEYCNRDAETSHVTVPSEGSKELVEKFRNKFIKEAQNIASLKHPHIISIHDVFEENGTAYYVMEYLDHGSLADLVKQRGRLPEADALSYIRQIADALRYIHARKMSHLDVKPGNILIDEEDHAVLIDFGLSKRYDDEGNQTSTTPVGISHGYAPLEQYKKGGVGTFSPATDIYSLGATLYKLITGTTPPDANDILTDGLPAHPGIMSVMVYDAIEQAMQPNKNHRPQSVEAFLALLDAPAAPAPETAKVEDVPTEVIAEEPASVDNDNTAYPLRLEEESPMERDSADITVPSPRAKSSFSPKKLLWPLLACVMAVVVTGLLLMYRPQETTHKTYTVNGVTFTMVKVDGGTFMMGAPVDDTLAYDDERPAHQVTVSDYAIGETEVTQALWQAVMGSNPSFFGNDLQRPVDEVSWNDCQLFIEKLNELTGAYFRLPTEAEWEFAARGGNFSKGYKYSGSNEYDDVVWCYENTLVTRAVKTKRPNELGLYDMNGNVWEWCADWHGNYPTSPQVDPQGPSSGTERVFRGGCAGGIENSCRIPSRSSNSPEESYKTYGLRLALQLDTLDAEFKVSRRASSAECRTIPLYVATTPSCVAVYVDGEKIGVTPINGLEIPAGKHRVELCKEGYEGKIIEQVFGGQRVSINDSLKVINPEKSLAVGFANGCEYIDLGLSVKWGTCNIGATTPYEHGERYAWGETGTKLEYTEKNSNTYGKQMNCIAGRPSYDVACAKWGDNWRLPTKEEYQELIDKCTWTWTTLNDVNGYRVTGPNGESIFLPVSGEYGDYWSSTPNDESPTFSYHLYFSSTEHRLYARGRRHSGLSIRPVLGHITPSDEDNLSGVVVEVSITETTTTTTPTSTTTTVTTTTTTTTSAPTQSEQKENTNKSTQAKEDAETQFLLGKRYYEGSGVKKDYAEAVRWFSKAAEQGHTRAQYMLGTCYFSGEGVTRDFTEAVKWYRKAAEKGNAEAQWGLGMCYEGGYGVTKDYAEAEKWYRKAAAQGHDGAKFDLENLPAQIQRDKELEAAREAVDAAIEEAKKEEEKAKAEKAKRAQLTGTINGHEYVDLGLSVKWATCNVGASSPSGYGNYYAWGETRAKSSYTEETYTYYENGEYVDIGSNISGTKYDAARANWGGTWRMPTLEEIKELKEKCTWTWTTQDGHNGYRVTGPNGKSIFLPAAGWRKDTSLLNAGSYGYCWSATPYSDNDRAYYLILYWDSFGNWYSRRYDGFTVRPVTE